MKTEELRSLQAPLKDKYREDPQTAGFTFRARGRLKYEDVAVRIESGHARVLSGLHAYAGGDGSFACSGDMLLEALVACAGVTLQAVATAMGLNIRGGTISAEGDADFRGTLAVDRAAPVGLTNIRLHVDLDTDADAKKMDTLLRLTERYCMVYQTLTNPPSITLTHGSG
jgi:uncharacterized OsmC-like protein